MTTDDQGLRAAAERIVAGITKTNGEHSTEYAVVDKDRFLFGLQEPYELAAAYLAEHRADDGEPLDVNWLRSVGFIDYVDPNKYCDAYLSLWMDRREHNVAILAVHWARPDNPAGHFWSANGYSLYRKAYPQTRGDVRNLAKCLGIELREPA